MRVGCVGLGVMGSAFANNLSRAGFQVIGYDLDRTAGEAIVSEGFEVAPTLDDLAHRSDVVLTSLPSERALFDVCEAFTQSEPGPPCVIELSTLSLATKCRAAEILSAAGTGMLDCPVSGTGSQAVSGDLVVFASGEERHFDSFMPVFAAISRKQLYVGPFGSGTKLKLVANTLITIHIAAAAEALALAEGAGLDLATTVDALSGSPASSSMFDVRAGLMAGHDYQPAQMRLALWLKDLGLIEEFAGDLGVPHSIFQACSERFKDAAELLPDDDTAAIFEVTPKAANSAD